MCTVSMVAIDWQNRNPQWVYPYSGGTTVPVSQPTITWAPMGPTKEEFDALKAELEELKKLLIAAKEYDTKTGQKDCEDPEKVRLFKDLAKLVGVDLKAIFE